MVSIIPKNNVKNSIEVLNLMLKELRATSGEFLSASILEVKKEEYVNIFNGIKKIQTRLYEDLGEEYNYPYHYSNQHYGDKVRILWINKFIDKPKLTLTCYKKIKPLLNWYN